jgi:hypothetical protein
MTSRFARAMWTLYEPIHAVSYFAPEPRAAFESAGLRGYWRGYFAGRAAPLGAVGAGPVIALFSGFAPAFVRRALPSIWSMATPAAALEARSAGAAAVLRRLAPDEDAAEQAAASLERVIDGLDFAGRALGASGTGIPPRRAESSSGSSSPARSAGSARACGRTPSAAGSGPCAGSPSPACC